MTGPVLEKNLLSEISSIMKDSKTANVNISTAATEMSSTANNEIYFDSGKFPPSSSMGEMGSGKPLRPSTSSVQVLRNSPRGSASALAHASSLKNPRLKMTNVLKEAAKRLGQEDPLSIAGMVSPSVEEMLVTHVSPNNENSTRKKARIESDDSGKENGVVMEVNGESSSSVWSSLSALETAVKESEESSPSFYSSSQSSHLLVEVTIRLSFVLRNCFVIENFFVAVVFLEGIHRDGCVPGPVPLDGGVLYV